MNAGKFTGIGSVFVFVGALGFSQWAAAWGCSPQVISNPAFQSTLDANKYLGIMNMKTFGDEAVKDFLAVINNGASPNEQVSFASSEIHAFSSTEGNYKIARHALRIGSHLDGYLANTRHRSYVVGLLYQRRMARMECNVTFDWGYFNPCVESTIQWCEVMDRGVLPADVERKLESGLALRAETGLKQN